jgi:hypothetical protein
MRRSAEIIELENTVGIVFPGAVDFMPDTIRARRTDAAGRPVYDRDGTSEYYAIRIAQDEAVAMANDAQPGLITAPNAGIPAFLSTYLDPKLIEVILQPTKAAEIYGETRKGDWLTETAMFPMGEYTGEVSTYGDFNPNGRSGFNAQWVNRQSYLFQTWTEWGEREMERYGLARVDYGARLNISSANTLNRYANLSYFYGVSGLACYGALNDPNLNAALTPTTKTAGGTSWAAALPTEILADIQKIFAQLQTQTGSNLEMDTPMTLALHSVSEVYLANTNSFGLTAMEMIKKVFPNLTVKQAPQFLSGTTYSCQLFVESIDGQKSIDAAYNEKMRAHRIVMDSTSARQKKTSGTWGAIWYLPIAVVSMTAI